jgi:hypothetical protein
LTNNKIDIKQSVQEEEDTASNSVIEEIKDEKPVPEEGSLKNSK